MSVADLNIAIFSAFTTDDDLSALIGARCYPLTGTPETPTKPYLTIYRISGSRNVGINGYHATHAAVRIQVNIYGSSFAQCNSVAAAIRGICSRGGPKVGGTNSTYSNQLRRLAIVDGPQDVPQYEQGEGQAAPALQLDIMACHTEA